MKFGKGQKPFNHIYTELLRKTYIQYVYNPQSTTSYVAPYTGAKKNSYTDLYLSNQAKESSEFSIDSIMSQESEALGDKIMNSAFAVYDRLKIHSYFNDRMTYNWIEIRNKMLELDKHNNYSSNLNSQDRRTGSLEASLVSIEKDILQEKIKCWQDLVKPSMYFIELVNQYQKLKQDKRLLE
ncbi:hypothetical protein HN747_03775 [archaeon]|jgi:transposase|nr:hypothetical protein [archaeon]